MKIENLMSEARRAADFYAAKVANRLGEGARDEAVGEWNQRWFWLWAAERVAEHAAGEKKWPECGARNFARAIDPQRAQHEGAALNGLRAALARLDGGSLPDFAEREKLVSQIAAFANTLLE